MITQTYNLIILDRSGSMSIISRQAITGVNETISTIRTMAKKTDMRQLVTLSSFCSCSMIDHYLNDDVTNVKPITDKEYQPCCCTPLYDAIGKCCTRLERQIGDRNDVAVSVTIITDGYENDSKEWTGAAVKKLIERLKEKGWLFAYIGANQDMEQVRFNMSIDNTLEFDASPQGAEKMFKRERAARMKWMKSVSHCDTSEVRDFNAGYFTQSESEPEDDWE
jgi:hypothetical protein